MSKPSFEVVWEKIEKNQNEKFNTKTGLPLTYTIDGDKFIPDRTKPWNITKGDFKKAYELVPIKGPGKISSLVNGSSYVWAVLHDSRIRGDNW